MRKVPEIEIRQAFDRVFNGQPNVMTPRPLEYGQVDDLLYEISAGEGPFGTPLYGLTVIQYDPPVHRPDLSGSFKSVTSLREYLRALG